MLKTAFRKQAKQKLIHTHKVQVKGFDTASEIFNRRLYEILKNLNSKNILFFMPFAFEPNIIKLVKKMRKNNFKIFVPYILDVSFKPLHFRMPFSKNHFGIWQPCASSFNLAKIDTAIVPVLGIDSNFKRIGFGKGMYDRFLTQKGTKKSKKINVIFVSRTCLFSKQIITQKHDVQGDFYISPFAESKRKKYGTSITFKRTYNIWRNS